MESQRLAHPSENDGVRIRRRGYNFTDRSDGLGRLDAGLLFLAYMRGPVTQYVPMQTELSRDDPTMAATRTRPGCGWPATQAHSWDDGTRRNFANDPLNLLAVDGPTNMAKGDSSPADWLPPAADSRSVASPTGTFVAVRSSV